MQKLLMVLSLLMLLTQVHADESTDSSDTTQTVKYWILDSVS